MSPRITTEIRAKILEIFRGLTTSLHTRITLLEEQLEQVKDREVRLPAEHKPEDQNDDFARGCNAARETFRKSLELQGYKVRG